MRQEQGEIIKYCSINIEQLTVNGKKAFYKHNYTRSKRSDNTKYNRLNKYINDVNFIWRLTVKDYLSV